MPVPPRPSSNDLSPSVHPEAAPSRQESQTRRMASNPHPVVEPEPAAFAGTLSVQVDFDDETDDLLRPTPVTPPPRFIPPPKPSSPGPGQPYEEGNVIAGKYRLVRIIGRGGMGAVWLAHNIPLDIDVAIKLIRRDRTGAESAGRLLQEARAVARLKHPSIVRVFDFGESEQGDPFIAMELLNGESLSTIIRRKRRIAPAVAVQTLLPVASALASAHTKGIVHRDLKPDNIFLVTEETGTVIPKIIDFGIVKRLSADPDRQVTMAGEVLGSPDYMSPEQARGAENIGEATDIWTFSVLLYESITGRRPFDGSNYNALIAAILTNDPVPIAQYGVNEPALWAILERGLAKIPDTRWPTMRDLGTQLAAWVVDRGIEDDVAGNPIAKQWLGGAMRRLITVYPEGNGPSAGGVRPAAGAPASSPPVPPPRQSVPSPQIPATPVDPTPDSWEPAEPRSRQGLWIVIGGALVALAAAAFLAREPLSRLFSPAPSVSSSAATVESAPSPAPPPPSAVETAAPQPSASATATSNKSAPPLKVPHVKGGKGPPAPTRINF